MYSGNKKNAKWLAGQSDESDRLVQSDRPDESDQSDKSDGSDWSEEMGDAYVARTDGQVGRGNLVADER